MFWVYLAIVLSPVAIGLAIGGSNRARGFIADHITACTAAGWSAVALAIPAAIALEGGTRLAALALLCPLMALGVWRNGGSGGDDGGGGGGKGPEPALPGPPRIDWDRFMLDFEEYAATHGQARRGYR